MRDAHTQIITSDSAFAPPWLSNTIYGYGKLLWRCTFELASALTTRISKVIPFNYVPHSLALDYEIKFIWMSLLLFIFFSISLRCSLSPLVLCCSATKFANRYLSKLIQLKLENALTTLTLVAPQRETKDKNVCKMFFNFWVDQKCVRERVMVVVCE